MKIITVNNEAELRALIEHNGDVIRRATQHITFTGFASEKDAVIAMDRAADRVKELAAQLYAMLEGK